MQTMVVLIEHTHKNAGPAEAKLHWSGFCTDTYTQMHRIRLRGSGGMLPKEILSQENFRKFDALRWF